MRLMHRYPACDRCSADSPDTAALVAVIGPGEVVTFGSPAFGLRRYLGSFPRTLALPYRSGVIAQSDASTARLDTMDHEIAGQPPWMASSIGRLARLSLVDRRAAVGTIEAVVHSAYGVGRSGALAGPDGAEVARVLLAQNGWATSAEMARDSANTVVGRIRAAIDAAGLHPIDEPRRHHPFVIGRGDYRNA